MTAPLDYYGRPVHVGDTLVSVCWDSRGFPQYLTSARLTVEKVNRTRVVVSSGIISGTVPVLSNCACIVERDGQPFPLDRDAWHAEKVAAMHARTS